jgi:hypothetical protein
MEGVEAQQEFLRAYWAEIDRDPDVEVRRAAIEEAESTGKLPEDAVYPSDYLRTNRL